MFVGSLTLLLLLVVASSLLLKAKSCGRHNSFHSNSSELLWVQIQIKLQKNVVMGCKKTLFGFWFSNSNMQKNGQTSNCRRSLVSILRYLLNAHIGLLAVASKTDVHNQILSSSNKSKTTYFAKMGKNIHSTLLVQTK